MPEGAAKDMKVQLQRQELSATLSINDLVRLREAATILVDEVAFELVDGVGIRVRCVDPAHVAMLDLLYANKSVKGSGKVAVDLETLRALGDLQEAGLGDEILTMDFIHQQSPETDGHLGLTTKWCTMNLRLAMAERLGEPKWPKLNLVAEFAVPAMSIQRAIKLASRGADHFEVTVRGKVAAIAFGDEDSQLHGNVLLDATGIKNANPNGARSLYSVDYFAGMLAQFKPGTKLLVQTGNDMPITVRNENADNSDAFTVAYMLAPRIESGV